MELPDSIAEAIAPLFKALPINQAMPELVPRKAQSNELLKLVDSIVATDALKEHPALRAGLWLYVDELDRSHEISQSISTPEGSLWHGVMHRREGDFWNSKYWFRKAGRDHALDSLDPIAFVDRVEQTYRDNPPELIDQQRKEWELLFSWCANQGRL